METNTKGKETSTTADEGLVLGADGLKRPTWASTNELLQQYYDAEWGMPVTDERAIFERLSLEAFQAGLSWLTILRKRGAFREAFAGFDPDLVAAFSDDDVARLLGGHLVEPESDRGEGAQPGVGREGDLVVHGSILPRHRRGKG